jgi:hypothetical protein
MDHLVIVDVEPLTLEFAIPSHETSHSQPKQRTRKVKDTKTLNKSATSLEAQTEPRSKKILDALSRSGQVLEFHKGSIGDT